MYTLNLSEENVQFVLYSLITWRDALRAEGRKGGAELVDNIIVDISRQVNYFKEDDVPQVIETEGVVQ